jgi:hypothetical protein
MYPVLLAIGAAAAVIADACGLLGHPCSGCLQAYPLLLLAAAAASAAGTGMQIAATEEKNSAKNTATSAELARQKGYQDQASQLATKSIEASTPQVAQTQINQGAAQRERNYAVVAPKAGPAPGQPTAVAGGPAERASAEAAETGNAWSKALSAAEAKQGGYADWGLQQQIKNTKARTDIGVVSNASRGSASVLPIEMNAASHKGDELAGWGQLVSALGMVAGMGAASAAPAAAGAASGASVMPTVANLEPVSVAGGEGTANAWSYSALPSSSYMHP